MVAHPIIIAGVDGMGAKYLPTIKDLKASQRFQEKQNLLAKLKKSSVSPAPKDKAGKKAAK